MGTAVGEDVGVFVAFASTYVDTAVGVNEGDANGAVVGVFVAFVGVAVGDDTASREA